MTPEQRILRARLAHAERFGDAATAESARRDFRASRAEDYIRRLVETWPPLSQEQRATLAALLRPSTVDEGERVT